MPSTEADNPIHTSADPARELDVVDQSPTIEHVEFCPGELPLRPCTPLGFNTSQEVHLCSIANACVPADISDCTLSLSERLPIPLIAPAATDMGDTALPAGLIGTQHQKKVASNSGRLASLDYRFSHESRGGTIVNSDDEDADSDDFDSDCSSCESSDDDSDVSLQSSPPMTPPSSPPRSVSRISFPFTCKSPQRVTTPPPTPPPVSRRSPPPPPVKRKFSCLPSPLSPDSAHRRNPFSVSPPRHKYIYHGHSQHALVNLKWFWTTRAEEWDGDNGACFLDAASLRKMPPLASTSAVEPGSVPPSNGGSSLNCARDDIDERPLLLPPLSIHPRRGDLGALRDPWCARIDRCFVMLPVWTISKTLWMYDLHIEADRRAKEEEFDAEEDVESEAETSASVGFSDDSDTTLVESESEGDLTRVVERQKRKEAVLEDPFSDSGKWALCASSHGAPTAGPSSLHSYPIVKVDSDSDLSCSSESSPFLDPLPVMARGSPQWTTNWYRRWELLIELTRRDQERKQMELEALTVPCATVSFAKGSRFFIAEEVDEAESDVWSEVWDPTTDDDTIVHRLPLPLTATYVSVLPVSL